LRDNAVDTSAAGLFANLPRSAVDSVSNAHCLAKNGPLPTSETFTEGSRMMKRVAVLGRTMALLGAIAVLVPLTASAASAAPSAKPAPAVAVKTTGMQIVGFDRAVAAAHGYEIKTAPDGREYSVKKGATATAAGGISTQNIVYGNCGSSYLWYNAIGNSSNRIQTGFNLNQAATSYWWLVVMRDGGGQSSRNWAGGLLLRTSWGVTSTVTGMTHGFSDAYVSTASSAILWNGGVCTSGGPSDFTWTY
jgi:hypothetical protein